MALKSVRKRRAAKYKAMPIFANVARGMSPSEFELRKCLGKLAWKSRREAERFAENANDRERGDELRPYRCQQCELWHLTTRGE